MRCTGQRLGRGGLADRRPERRTINTSEGQSRGGRPARAARRAGGRSRCSWGHQILFVVVPVQPQVGGVSVWARGRKWRVSLPLARHAPCGVQAARQGRAPGAACCALGWHGMTSTPDPSETARATSWPAQQQSNSGARAGSVAASRATARRAGAATEGRGQARLAASNALLWERCGGRLCKPSVCGLSSHACAGAQILYVFEGAACGQGNTKAEPRARAAPLRTMCVCASRCRSASKGQEGRCR